MKKKAASLVMVFLAVLLLVVGLVLVEWRNRQNEQSQIQATVRAYLHMNATYGTIVKETRAVTQKSSAEEQDELVRQRVLEAYRKILTGKILQSYENTVRTYTIFSDDYQMLFADLQKIRINRVQLAPKGPKQCFCSVSLISNESYNPNLFTPELKTLIKDYQVTNYTQAKFDALANRCKLFRLEVYRKDIFKLVKTANGWLIAELKGDIEHSKLNVIME